jgi:hypothetical protein
MEAQLHRWLRNSPAHYFPDGLVLELGETGYEKIEFGEPKRHDGILRSWNKVVYGSGLHRRGWRDNESGTDTETVDLGNGARWIQSDQEVDKPLDTHRVGRTERAIEKIDKAVDYDDDESIGNDREATIEAARLNKRLAKKLAKQRRTVDVGDNDDQPDIAVYDLKTEGSRRFGDDTEITVRDVVTVNAGDVDETETDIEDNGILNALERGDGRAYPLVGEHSSQAARPRR